MSGNGLRSRLFQAIGVVVLICVAFTIGVGLVLTDRAVKRATLKDLAHQADLIAAVAGRQQPESSAEAAALPPAAGGALLGRRLGSCRLRPGGRSHTASRRRADAQRHLLRGPADQAGNAHPPATGEHGELAAVAVRLGPLVAARAGRPPRRARRLPPGPPHLAAGATASRPLRAPSPAVRIPSPCRSREPPRSRRSLGPSTSWPRSSARRRRRSGTSSSRSATS